MNKKLIQKIRTLAVYVFSVCIILSAFADTTMIEISGSAQGLITDQDNLSAPLGPVDPTNVTILATEMSLELNADSSSRAAVKKVINPIIITKKVDYTSPLLMSALANIESMEFSIKYLRPAADGTTEHYYTLSSNQAVLSGISSFIEDGIAYENIRFTIQNLTATYETTGTSITIQ